MAADPASMPRPATSSTGPTPGINPTATPATTKPAVVAIVDQLALGI